MIDKISPQTSMKAIHQILRPCPKFCWLINHFTDKYESHASIFKTEPTLKCRNVFSNIRQIVQSLRKSLQILIYSDVHKGSIYEFTHLYSKRMVLSLKFFRMPLLTAILGSFKRKCVLAVVNSWYPCFTRVYVYTVIFLLILLMQWKTKS